MLQFVQRLKVELEPFFYCNNGAEICTIGKSVSLCSFEDVELQSMSYKAQLHLSHHLLD